VCDEPKADYPDDLLVQEARDRYLARNGFKVADYTAPSFQIRVLGIPLRFPNPPSRQRVVPLHDLHHVLTGFGTDWIGEAEIGAWELRAGCNTFIAWLLNGGGVILGLLMCPSRVWRAFRRAKGQRTLYYEKESYEQLLQMKVGELRQRLGMV
jgi:hypothetical protein